MIGKICNTELGSSECFEDNTDAGIVTFVIVRFSNFRGGFPSPLRRISISVLILRYQTWKLLRRTSLVLVVVEVQSYGVKR